MKRTSAIHAYVWSMAALAGLLLAFVDWSQLARFSSTELLGLGTLALLALFSEQQAVSIGAGKVSGGSSVGFLPLFTILLLFGPVAAVATMLVTGPAVEYLIRQKEPIRANFNIAQYVCATALGGLAFTAAGGAALFAHAGPSASSGSLDQVGPFVLFAVVVLLFNNAAVTLAIALSQGMAFTEVWSNLVARSGANILSDLLVAPVAIAVAALYVQIGTWGLILAILPLLFIRHSYLTTFRLQEANRDLLKALVKAIETRDPYTSGHSRRVATLARSIGVSLGLSARKLEELESAALLHDIGKIEGVYSEILEKPGALSTEERVVIESHVTKGAELLRQLTSFGEEVILPVLHHHEHFDGSGYPDGLEAEEIPLGARVIKVCDAIDAMLSDRPYRRALRVPEVHEQLRLYSGRHFDQALVEIVLKKDLIREHNEVLATSDASSPSVHGGLGPTPGRAATKPRARVSSEQGIA